MRRLSLAFNRPVFTASLAYLIFHMSLPSPLPLARVLRSVLSWRIWFPIANLCYGIYLLHFRASVCFSSDCSLSRVFAAVVGYAVLPPLTLAELEAKPWLAFVHGVLVFVVSALVALPIHLLVEKPGTALGHWVLTCGRKKREQTS